MAFTLSLNRLVEGGRYSSLRKCIWIYFILLLSEGALRKWILPDYATPLLVIRDPLAIWICIQGLKYGLIKSNYMATLAVVTAISFFATMTVGHQNLMAALYGWRIYILHFPIMFIMGNILTREDVIKFLRCVLFVSIPMTVLVVVQFYSPQTAWVNIGVGGEVTSGLGGAMGYMRPAGVFSFTQGYVMFQGLVGCALCYYLVNNKKLPRKLNVKPLMLYICIICYIVALPTSISRTNIFQTAFFIALLVVGLAIDRRINSKGVGYFVMTAIIIFLIIYSHIIDTNIDAMSARFENANEAEGGLYEGTIANRYFGSFIRAFVNNVDLPFFGIGLGAGTSVGANFLGENIWSSGFNGEEEWSRMTGECGVLLGTIVILIRVLLSLSIFKQSYNMLKKYSDFLSWTLMPAVLLFLTNGQLSAPTSLGFIVMIVGLALASVKTTR